MTDSITVDDSEGTVLARGDLLPTTGASSIGRALWSDERQTRVKFTLSHGNLVIVAPRQEPSWFYPSLNALKELSRLPPGWDSYDGHEISDLAIVGAVESLIAVLGRLGPESPEPDIVPTSEGGIQLEWHGRGAAAELRVSPTGKVSAFFRDPATGTSGEFDSVGKDEFRCLAQTVAQI
jgi:hypothetical protein